MSSSQGPTKQQRWRRGPDQPSSRDASEEDNDDSTGPPTASSSLQSDGISRSSHFRSAKAPAVGRANQAIARESSIYDGDIESSGASTTGYDGPASTARHGASSSLSSAVARDNHGAPGDESTVSPTASGFDVPPIVELPQEDIRAFVQRALDGVPEPGWPKRDFKVNPPATDRPVRIYADGVYDLCHFGHALQMRQAKLSFPSVHLLIGVCSDELCREHKSLPAMSHAERCASVKHCRWVDEVVPDAPWEVTQEFIDRYEIDYIAHDEEPYTSAGKEDVYAFVKKQGRFLPTRRTPGISTSELLERIVSQYRAGAFDGKLEKIGHAELKADRIKWDAAKTPQ